MDLVVVGVGCGNPGWLPNCVEAVVAAGWMVFFLFKVVVTTASTVKVRAGPRVTNVWKAE